MMTENKEIRFSLLWTAVIGITGLIILAVSVLTVFFINHQKKIVFENLKKRGTELAANLAQNSAYAVLTQNTEILRNFSANLLNLTDVKYCFFMNESGQELLEAGDPQLIKDARRWVNHSFKPGASFLTPDIHSFQAQTHETFFNFAVPITTPADPLLGGEGGLFTRSAAADSIPEKRIIGILHLGLSARSALQDIKKSQWDMFLLTVFIILIAVIVTIAASRMAIRPLLSLVEGVQHLAQGDLDIQIKSTSRNEIGTLIKAFNHMVKDLQTTTVSRDYVDNIIASITDILFVLSPDGTISAVNKAACSHLGYCEKELIGQDVNILADDTEKTLKRMILDKLKEFDTIINYETHLCTKKGDAVPVLLSGAVLKDKDYLTHESSEESQGRDRKIQDIVCVAKDISGKKKAEEELKKANEELIANERALKNIMQDMRETHEKLKKTQAQLIQSEKLASLGELSAGIAHEINNPLGFIDNNIVILEEYIDSYKEILQAVDVLKQAVSDKNFEKASDMIGQINTLGEKVNIEFINSDIKDLMCQSKNGTERIKKIVQDLKTFTRKDEGLMEINDLEKIMDGVINIVWNEIKYTAELKKNYGGLPPVRCNAQKIGQVFVNLLVNATQAIKEKGEILIRTYPADPYVCIEISDTGCGINREEIARIFDPFFTTKKVGEGTGLGLSISYDLVKQHKGNIEVESEVGKGTTFTVKLPM